MRLFFTGIFLVCFAAPGLAQDDAAAATGAALQAVLANLEESVQKLGSQNDHLAVRDTLVRQQIMQLRAQLDGLQAQGSALNKQAAALQANDPKQAQQIVLLQKQNDDLDNRIQTAQVLTQSTQRSVEAAYGEEQKLLLQLKDMTAILQQPAAPVSALGNERQKEKLGLIKMIYESRQRQIELNKQLRRGPRIGGAPARVRQLEDELNQLVKNYQQFKTLLDTMSQKSGASRPIGDRVEEEKLQGKIDQLNHEGASLKNQLDDLRAQMVELDKRKSRLQQMLHQH